jgi:hypothetical protein
MERKYFDNYIKTQKKMLHYVFSNAAIPAEVELEVHHALRELRGYMHDNGMRMPIPKYHYDFNDKRTWKYLGIISTQKCPHKELVNPLFKYA